MNRIGISLLIAVLAASVAFSQDLAAAPKGAPDGKGHGAFPVRITKSLDSAKLKEGDAIEVETAAGFQLPDGTLVPKGSKLTGYATAAKARSKGDQKSQLTLVFDKLNFAGGRQLSVKGMVQAVFPPPDEADPEVPGSSSHQGGQGSVPMPDYRPTTDIKVGSNTNSSTQPQTGTDPNSVGVHGFDNLQLEDGVLSSKGKNVKLGSGVRLVVRVVILG